MVRSRAVDTDSMADWSVLRVDTAVSSIMVISKKDGSGVNGSIVSSSVNSASYDVGIPGLEATAPGMSSLILI